MPTGDHPLWGPASPSWKGDAASVGAKRLRAQKRYELGPCERCGKPATDRHHKDADVGNNEVENIAILCRRCHMIVDGRMDRFVKAMGSRGPGRSHCKGKPPAPCIICKSPAKPSRKGRCQKCSDYFRAHGKERWYQLALKASENAARWNAVVRGIDAMAEMVNEVR